MLNSDIVYVYTDGACSNNGKKNAKAGIGIYFSQDDSRNCSEKITGKQTNNTAEIKAIIKAYDILKNEIEEGKLITIVSDSNYAIRAATDYGKKCSKTNFQKIPNSQLVKEVYNLCKDKENVTFLYVKAHTKNKDIHSLGNREADRLAVMSLI